MNQRIPEIFGLGPDDTDELACFVQDVDPQYKSFMRRLIELSRTKPGTMLVEEVPSHKVDGTPFINRVRGTVVDEPDGTELGYLVMSDVTEQHNLQQVYYRQQEIYKMVLESSEDILFEYDVQFDSLHLFNNTEDLSRGVYERMPDFTNYLHSRLAKHPGATNDSFLKAFEYVKTHVGEGEQTFAANILGDKVCWFRASFKSLPCKDDPSEVNRVIGLLREISEEQRLKEELANETKQREQYQQRAAIDQLTGVLSRWAFQEQIPTLIGAHPEGSTLLMFDLDNFKLVNDTYGHQTGDELLRRLGGGLRKMLRKTDLIGRYGGDEFVVFMPGNADIKVARERAVTIICCVKGIREQLELDIEIGASVGIAMSPEDGTYLRELYASADKALYEAKNSGKNHCVFAS